MPAVSGYTLDLYCDTEFKDFSAEHSVHEYGEFPHEYVGEITRSQARTMARKDGWLIKKNGKTYCPKCSGKKGNRK